MMYCLAKSSATP